jgi:hypothetical protein
LSWTNILHVVVTCVKLIPHLGELKGLYLKSIVLSVKQEAIEEKIKSLLRSKGVPAVAIKGNEIAKEIYNDPNCRTSSDVDILIKRSHTFKVHDILLNAGGCATKN